MNNSNDATSPWNIESARGLYNISRWGAKYFDINDAGHVVAKPLQEAGASVDITDVIEEAKSRGLKCPILIRFQDILRHRVEAINKAFNSFHRGVWLSGKISRRVSDQGEPTPRSRGRNS